MEIFLAEMQLKSPEGSQLIHYTSVFFPLLFFNNGIFSQGSQAQRNMCFAFSKNIKNVGGVGCTTDGIYTGMAGVHIQ